MYLFLPWAALALFIASAALWKPLPRSHRRFRGAFGFLALWFLLWTGASAASWLHIEARSAQQIALSLIELAAIQFAAGLLFDFAVEKARVPRFAGEVTLVGCYIFVLATLLYRLGVNVTGIFATSAVAAAVLGFALQDMLSNIASGVALEFESDIRVGDFIKCGDASGWVRYMRLRHTAIDTPDGDRIMLPNSVVTRSPVMVVARSRRRFIPFTMPYSRNPQELIDAVCTALRASSIPDIASDPPPSCIILDMAPGHIQYAAVVWMLRPGHESFAVSAVLNRIYFSLLRAGIPATEISQSLELKATTESQPASASPTDILRRTPIFRLLDDSALSGLSAHLRHLSFAPGELIIRQGEEGDSMYFVTAGQVAIKHVGSDRTESQVAVILPGEFFGEASLLTGEARNANALALSRVDCYKLDKAGLEGIMGTRPDLAEDISVVIARRQMELATAREKLDLETARLREAENQKQLLSRIRRFFGMNTSSAKV